MRGIRAFSASGRRHPLHAKGRQEVSTLPGARPSVAAGPRRIHGGSRSLRTSRGWCLAAPVVGSWGAGSRPAGLSCLGGRPAGPGRRTSLTHVCPAQSSFLKFEVIAAVWNLGDVTWEIKGVWRLRNDPFRARLPPETEAEPPLPARLTVHTRRADQPCSPSLSGSPL